MTSRILPHCSFGRGEKLISHDKTRRFFPNMETDARKVNWVPLPDPVAEEQVRITFGDWTADERTRVVIERQSKIMGFANPTDYLRQALAAVIAANEQDTILADDGRILCSQYGYNKNGESQDV